MAITMNFVGSPHVDMNDTGPQYALSLGSFANGGELCVEVDPLTVALVETKGRLAHIDGRFTHWVRDYEGDRFSVIYYQVEGERVAPTVAVHAIDRGDAQAELMTE